MTLWGWFYNYSHLLVTMDKWQRDWVTGPNSQSWWMVELQFSFRSLAPEVSALCCAASDLALSYLLTNKKLEIRPATPFSVINRRIKQFSISSSWCWNQKEYHVGRMWCSLMNIPGGEAIAQFICQFLYSVLMANWAKNTWFKSSH